MQATRKEVIAELQPSRSNPALNAFACLYGDLERYAMMRFLLHHRCTGTNLVADADVLDAQASQVTRVKLRSTSAEVSGPSTAPCSKGPGA